MKKVKKDNQKTKRRFVFLVPICWLFIGFFCYNIFIDYTKASALREEKSTLNNKLVEMKEEEELLKVDIEKLNDPDYIGRYAREKYLYSKTGEFIIKID